MQVEPQPCISGTTCAYVPHSLWSPSLLVEVGSRWKILPYVPSCHCSFDGMPHMGGGSRAFASSTTTNPSYIGWSTSDWVSERNCWAIAVRYWAFLTVTRSSRHLHAKCKTGAAFVKHGLPCSSGEIQMQCTFWELPVLHEYSSYCFCSASLKASGTSRCMSCWIWYYWSSPFVHRVPPSLPSGECCFISIRRWIPDQVCPIQLLSEWRVVKLLIALHIKL